MSIKSDRWIRQMALEHGMIEPFADRQVREGVISYGVSSYGRYPGRKFDEVEADLSRDWDSARGKSSLSWVRAKNATRDAWDRISA